MQYTLSNEYISITVDSLGAELISLKKGDTEYLYQKQEGFWQRQSPILFPIIGALKNGSYTHDGQDFSLSQHGFARDMEWELIEHVDGKKLMFRLASTSQTHEKYPFDFEIILSYVLKKSALIIEYTAKNTGTETMYFSLGAHPAFALDNPISDYALVFPQDEYVHIDRLCDGLLSDVEDMDISDHSLFLSEDLFDRDAIILRSLQTRAITLQK